MPHRLGRSCLSCRAATASTAVRAQRAFQALDLFYTIAFTVDVVLQVPGQAVVPDEAVVTASHDDTHPCVVPYRV